jgi:hypothetical protein
MNEMSERSMNRLLKQVFWGTTIVLLAISLTLAACGGSADQAAEEPAPTEAAAEKTPPLDEVTVEVPFGLRIRDALGGFDLKWLAGVFIFPLFFYILSRRDHDRGEEN